MGVKTETYDHLCQLYPKTAEALKDLALIKREIYLHYMETAISLDKGRSQTGIPASLHNSGEEMGTPTSDSIRRHKEELQKEQQKNDQEILSITQGYDDEEEGDDQDGKDKDEKKITKMKQPTSDSEIDIDLQHKKNIADQLTRMGDSQLLENAQNQHSWHQMKQIANGEYSFQFRWPLTVTQFLPSECVDGNNKMRTATNQLKITNTLSTVKNLDRLLNKVKHKEYHIKKPHKSMQLYYLERFGE